MYYGQPQYGNGNYYGNFPTQPKIMEPQSGLKGRPVSSLDEVRGAQIDFDGSISFFPDFANKRIYTKQINLDGSPCIKTYVLHEEVAPTPPEYVTKEEFDTVVEQLKKLLSEKSEVALQTPASASKIANF